MQEEESRSGLESLGVVILTFICLFYRETSTNGMRREKNIDPYVIRYAGAISDIFIFMDDSVRQSDYI